jgi:hypothetical protein
MEHMPFYFLPIFTQIHLVLWSNTYCKISVDSGSAAEAGSNFDKIGSFERQPQSIKGSKLLAICRVYCTACKACNCTALVLILFQDLDWRNPFYTKLLKLSSLGAFYQKRLQENRWFLSGVTFPDFHFSLNWSHVVCPLTLWHHWKVLLQLEIPKERHICEK